MRLKKLISHVILAGGALAMAFPFLWLLSTSLMKKVETEEVPINLVPSVPQFINYVDALRAAPFGRYFLNTVVVSVAVTICVLVT